MAFRFIYAFPHQIFGLTHICIMTEATVSWVIGLVGVFLRWIIYFWNADFRWRPPPPARISIIRSLNENSHTSERRHSKWKSPFFFQVFPVKKCVNVPKVWRGVSRLLRYLPLPSRWVGARMSPRNGRPREPTKKGNPSRNCLRRRMSRLGSCPGLASKPIRR